MDKFNIYYVSLNSKETNLGNNFYTGFFISCETEEIARNSHPSDGEYKWWTNENYIKKYDSWVNPGEIKNLQVQHIGVVVKTAFKGILCSSFTSE